jgi:hypothetical protein
MHHTELVFSVLRYHGIPAGVDSVVLADFSSLRSATRRIGFSEPALGA